MRARAGYDERAHRAVQVVLDAVGRECHRVKHVRDDVGAEHASIQNECRLTVKDYIVGKVVLVIEMSRG